MHVRTYYVLRMQCKESFEEEDVVFLPSMLVFHCSDSNVGNSEHARESLFHITHIRFHCIWIRFESNGFDVVLVSWLGRPVSWPRH
jgi:hypothetical protein